MTTRQLRLPDTLRADLIKAAGCVIECDPHHQPVALGRFAQLLLEEGARAVLDGEARSLRAAGARLHVMTPVENAENCPRFVRVPHAVGELLRRATLYIQEHDPARRPVHLPTLAMQLIAEGADAAIHGRVRPLTSRRTSNRGRKPKFIVARGSRRR